MRYHSPCSFLACVPPPLQLQSLLAPACSLEEDEERERGITPMYVKYDARLYGPRKPGQKVRLFGYQLCPAA